MSWPPSGVALKVVGQRVVLVKEVALECALPILQRYIHRAEGSLPVRSVQRRFGANLLQPPAAAVERRSAQRIGGPNGVFRLSEDEDHQAVAVFGPQDVEVVGLAQDAKATFGSECLRGGGGSRPLSLDRLGDQFAPISALVKARVAQSSGQQTVHGAIVYPLVAGVTGWSLVDQ